MKKAKMSVQQRKYFVDRISKTINIQILDLRQQSAAQVYDVSEAAYSKYLKALGIDKSIKEYTKLRDKVDILGSKIKAVYDEVRKTVEDPDLSWSYRQDIPSLYSNMSEIRDVNKAFRWACNETAKKNDKSLTITDEVKKLESKKDTAIDILHGVDEFADTLGAVNKALKGTDVPRLGV